MPTPIFQRLQARIDGLGDSAVKQFIDFAAEKRDEVLAEGRATSVTTYVNGREGAALETATVPGVIRFEFGYLDYVIDAIWELLVQQSPYRDKRDGANPPTHYRDEHLLLVNGQEVVPPIQQIPRDAEIAFVNVQPYARKIEKGFSAQAPNGVYQQVARLANTRFGNLVSVTYTWLQITGAGPSGPASRHRTRRQKAQDDNFPAIIFKSL